MAVRAKLGRRAACGNLTGKTVPVQLLDTGPRDGLVLHVASPALVIGPSPRLLPAPMTLPDVALWLHPACDTQQGGGQSTPQLHSPTVLPSTQHSTAHSTCPLLPYSSTHAFDQVVCPGEAETDAAQ
ncbi:hypothetical protein J1614_000511 [Plenodomus biglobosus]|nr:hypothetical protein J1614_000511 [Plenodomus biglobosus]